MRPYEKHDNGRKTCLRESESKESELKVPADQCQKCIGDQDELREGGGGVRLTT